MRSTARPALFLPFILRQRWHSLIPGLALILLAACNGEPGTTAPKTALLAETVSSTVTLPGTRSAYQVMRTSSGATVTDSNGVTTTYAGAQVLRFADVSMNLAIGAQALRVNPADLTTLIELYIAFFNRIPDADGLGYWIDQFVGGKSIEQIADSFYAAAVQFSSLTNYTSSMTNTDFVRIIYKNVLGRSGTTAPPQADVDYWAGKLADGSATRGSLVKTMLGAAHTYKGDATWGWVANLLDNKSSIGRSFAVENGLAYLTNEDSISKGMAIAQAVTSTGTTEAQKLMPVTEASFSLTTQARNAAQPNYGATALRAQVDVPPVTPVANAKTAGKTIFFHYDKPRATLLADLNNDGLDDLIVAPTMFDQGPKLPVELWLNRGNGVFENATASLVSGPVPVTGSVNNILVADFNRDGVPDIFFVDQGLEDKDCGATPGCDGGRNIVLMSQPDGKLKDTSATALPNNVLSFNHVSSMGDVNGDGLLDVVVVRLGGFTLEGDGVLVYLNRGDGSFSMETTSLLPDEIAYIPSATFYTPAFDAAHPPPFSRQRAGSATVGDLDGDGVNEIVTCSYAGADGYTNDRTVRIFKRGGSGKFAEAARLSIPAALKANTELGCSGLSIADADGDGLAELLVIWESRIGNGVNAVLLHNLGGMRFEDLTTSALGGYAINFLSNGYNFNPLTYAFRDINGDGLPDIVFGVGGVKTDMFVSGMPTARINLGNLHFTKQVLKLDGSLLESAKVSSVTGCDWCSYSPLYGRLQKHGPNDSKLELLLFGLNEGAITTPILQEGKVTLFSLLAK